MRLYSSHPHCVQFSKIITCLFMHYSLGRKQRSTWESKNSSLPMNEIKDGRHGEKIYSVINRDSFV